MEAMRNSWTDERLDDGFERVGADIALLRGELHREVGSLREELHREVGSLREETGSLREETGSLRKEMGSLRTEMHQGFNGLNRSVFQIGGGIIAALIGVIATQL